MYFESYGNAVIQTLTRASRSFFLEPPAGFADTPLLRPRGLIWVADQPRSERLAKLLRDNSLLREISVGEALGSVSILDPDWVSMAASDDSGFDIDVAALTQGYLIRARHHGVQIVLNAVSTTIERRGLQWIVSGQFGQVEAPILVNAAGAWADEVANSVQARPLGLTAYRRTALIIPAPEGAVVDGWPMVIDVDEEFYFKPDSGRLLLSPANEDPETPCDTVPDELDVALAVDRFERATRMSVSRVTHRWAGLRTFAPDRTPVVGYDPQVDGFFWLAGQGGYGLQTAPALSRLAAALLLRDAVAPAVMPSVAPLSPGRAELATVREKSILHDAAVAGDE